MCSPETRSAHDLYLNPEMGKKQPVPRHNEIDESLARHIINIDITKSFQRIAKSIAFAVR
jgi:hypothetical protein